MNIIYDREGTILPDMEHARFEASEDARHLMAEAVRNGQDISSRVFHICDETGSVLVTLPFKDTIVPEDRIVSSGEQTKGD